MASSRTGGRLTSSCVWSSDQERVHHLLVRQDTYFNFCTCTSSRTTNLITRLYVLVTVFGYCESSETGAFFSTSRKYALKLILVPHNPLWALSSDILPRVVHTLRIPLWRTMARILLYGWGPIGWCDGRPTTHHQESLWNRRILISLFPSFGRHSKRFRQLFQFLEILIGPEL